MFKITIFSSVLVLGLCQFSRLNQRLNDPIDPNEVKNLVSSYVDDQDGKYTKKTHIHLNDEAIEELKEYFHCGQNAKKRRTYYDESVDALLMGDYDGGFSNINSGYAKNGDNMEHYVYKDASNPDVETLFSAKNVNYVVNNTSPNQFFINLSKIALETINHDWKKEDDIYTYEITSLEKENEYFADLMLHDVLYFAAPMLLEKASSYLSFNKITLGEVDSKLIISLYVSLGDISKLDNNEGLLSTAVIEKGLILN